MQTNRLTYVNKSNNTQITNKNFKYTSKDTVFTFHFFSVIFFFFPFYFLPLFLIFFPAPYTQRRPGLPTTSASISDTLSLFFRPFSAFPNTGDLTRFTLLVAAVKFITLSSAHSDFSHTHAFNFFPSFLFHFFLFRFVSSPSLFVLLPSRPALSPPLWPFFFVNSFVRSHSFQFLRTICLFSASIFFFLILLHLLSSTIPFLPSFNITIPSSFFPIIFFFTSFPFFLPSLSLNVSSLYFFTLK